MNTKYAQALQIYGCHYLMKSHREAFIHGVDWAEWQGRWVPVGDRLPGNETAAFSVNVRFVTKDCGQFIGYVDLESGQWYARDKKRIENVTHWIYLDEPPVQEGGTQ